MKTINVVNGPHNASSIILGSMRMPALSKLKPIIYDEEQVQYLSVGDKVSDAFKVGMELKKTFARDAEQGI